MKSNLWTIIIAIGIIGLIIFAIQWNATQPDPPPITSAPATGPTKTSIVSTQFSISTTIIATPSPTKKTGTPGATPIPLSTKIPAIYIIQSGDTPYAIANLYGISVDDLMAANNITDPTTLQIGQELRIPSGQVEKSTPAAGDSTEHQIQNGDTLFSLANQYGSTIDEILANNPGLEPTSLQVGQTIVIPLTRPIQQATALSTTENPDSNGTPPISEPPPAGKYELSLEMINAINTERQNNGLPPLEADEQLAAVALTHAQDMVSRNFFDHVTPDGKSLRDRLQAQGLEPYWVGENIQRNTEPPDQTVQAAVGWFMESPPHRDNILHSNFTHIGAGVVEGPPGWYTFVLVFAQM